METTKFINEIGNKIQIKIKNKNGVGKNYKTGEKIKYKGASVQIIGPTSMSENEITYMEAVELHKVLSKFLKNKKK